MSNAGLKYVSTSCDCVFDQPQTMCPKCLVSIATTPLNLSQCLRPGCGFAAEGGIWCASCATEVRSKMARRCLFGANDDDMSK